MLSNIKHWLKVPGSHVSVRYRFPSLTHAITMTGALPIPDRSLFVVVFFSLPSHPQSRPLFPTPFNSGKAMPTVPMLMSCGCFSSDSPDLSSVYKYFHEGDSLIQLSFVLLSVAVYFHIPPGYTTHPATITYCSLKQ